VATLLLLDGRRFVEEVAHDLPTPAREAESLRRSGGDMSPRAEIVLRVSRRVGDATTQAKLERSQKA
jgi:hypothetical protein